MRATLEEVCLLWIRVPLGLIDTAASVQRLLQHGPQVIELSLTCSCCVVNGGDGRAWLGEAPKAAYRESPGLRAASPTLTVA